MANGMLKSKITITGGVKTPTTTKEKTMNMQYVKCKGLNIWNGTPTTENRWVDVSDVFKELWSDLSSDCQDYVMSLDKYKDMDFDTMLKKYDDETYDWIKKTDAWNLKGFGLNYSE